MPPIGYKSSRVFKRRRCSQVVVFCGKYRIPIFSLSDTEIGRHERTQRLASRRKGSHDAIDLSRQGPVVELIQTCCAQSFVTKDLMRAARPCNCIKTPMSRVQYHQLHYKCGPLFPEWWAIPVVRLHITNANFPAYVLRPIALNLLQQQYALPLSTLSNVTSDVRQHISKAEVTGKVAGMKVRQSD